jgi:hypothetical protein
LAIKYQHNNNLFSLPINRFHLNFASDTLTFTWKCALYEQLSCVYRFKLYSLHSMEKWNCPLLSVICHIQVPFKAGLTCWALLHFILKVESITQVNFVTCFPIGCSYC